MRRIAKHHLIAHLFWIAAVPFAVFTATWVAILIVAVTISLVLTLVYSRAIPPRQALPERTVPWQPLIDRYYADTRPTATMDFVIDVDAWPDN
jgi:low affinity Fe/Cu permease